LAHHLDEALNIVSCLNAGFLNTLAGSVDGLLDGFKTGVIIVGAVRSLKNDRVGSRFGSYKNIK
jgi:hypothetical protein